MTPNEYNEQAKNKAIGLNKKIENIRKKLNIINAILGTIYIVGFILILAFVKDIHSIEIPFFILTAVFATTMLADMCSLYMYTLTDEDKDTLLYINIFKNYDYVKYNGFWIFYQPGLRSTYYFLDKDFDIIIRNLHLKPGYQKQLNNELNAISRGESLDSNASINKLIQEINITDTE